jgi:signal transduction histidine kinase
MNRIYSGINAGAEETARITAGLVHDLNNLLMILYGHVELLNLKKEEHGVLVVSKDTLTIMEGALNQGRAISNQLMDLCISNLNQSIFSANQSNELDMNQVVRRAMEMVGSKNRNDLVINIELETWVWPVHGDALSIQRLLVNLVENACAAILEGGVITLSTANVHLEDRPHVRLSVQDTGSGMEESALDQIFDPLYTTKSNGHGIGMSVVKQVAEDHGGLVEVASTPGQGTEVRVYFPAVNNQAVVGG